MTDTYPTNANEISSRDVLDVFWQRKHIILACVIVTTLAAYIASMFFQTSIFQAKTSILVREEKLNPADAFPQFEANNPYLASQAEILKSDRMVNAAIAKILSDTQANSSALNLNRMVDERYITQGLDSVNAWVVGISNIIELSVDHEDPYVAAVLANTISRTYIEGRMADKTRLLDNIVASHEAKLDQAIRDMQRAEQELISYANTQQAVLFAGTDIVVDLNRYARFEEMRAQVDAEAEKLKAQMLEMKQSSAGPAAVLLPAVVNSPGIRDLNNMLRAAQARRDELLANYTVDHPSAVSVATEIDRIGVEIENERQRITAAEIKAVELEYNALQRKKDVLVAEQKQQAARLNDLLAKQPVLAQLQHEVDAQRGLYREILKQQQNLELVRSRSIEIYEGQVVQEAEVPEKPIKPDVLKNIFFGAMAGFTLGCAFVLFAGAAPKPQRSASPQQAQPQRVAERRRSPRTQAYYEVAYAKIGGQQVGRSSDISRHGMRLITEELLSKGLTIDFAIQRPDTGPLTGKGSVVWSAPAQVNGKDGFYASGVTFRSE